MGLESSKEDAAFLILVTNTSKTSKMNDKEILKGWKGGHIYIVTFATMPHIAHWLLRIKKKIKHTDVHRGLMVICIRLKCETVAADICSCLKCKVGFCMFRYFRASK